jgi:hypothetical protein
MAKKIALFLLSLFLLLWGMEKCYDYFLRKNVNLKSAYVSSHRIDAKVVFLGPCEPLWMMSPELFQKYTGLSAYNLSTVHANFAENEAMLDLYLSHNKAPEYLFVYVTGESLDGSFNVFNTYNFAPFLDDLKIKEIVQNQDPDYSRYTCIPFMKYAYYNDFVSFNFIQGIKHTLQKRDLPYFPNGYIPPHDIVWDGRLERFEQENPKGRRFNWNEEEVTHLKSLLNLASHAGITTILYESPMLNEIKAFLPNRDEIKNKISKFAEENYVDYWVFDTMKISDSRSCFFSILNTNDKGSAIFNKTFAECFNDRTLIKMLPIYKGQ